MYLLKPGGREGRAVGRRRRGVALRSIRTRFRKGAFSAMTLLVSWRSAIVGVSAVLLTSVIAIRADGQDRDNNRDDAARARLPQLGRKAQVPACYNSLSGDWRVVHPWSSKKSPGAVCRPPAPWDTVNVPPDGWGQAICTAGGAFDCDANESFI